MEHFDICIRRYEHLNLENWEDLASFQKITKEWGEKKQEWVNKIQDQSKRAMAQAYFTKELLEREARDQRLADKLQEEIHILQKLKSAKAAVWRAGRKQGFDEGHNQKRTYGNLSPQWNKEAFRESRKLEVVGKWPDLF
jgi:hypothetical protein